MGVEDDCESFGTVGTLAYDVIMSATSCFVTGPQGGNIVGQDPLLGPLANNGGATQTRALLPGSKAIDAGAPNGCVDEHGALLTIDQRGFVRPVNGGKGRLCDIGAYEYYPLALFLPLVRHEQQPGIGLAIRKEVFRRRGLIASAPLGSSDQAINRSARSARRPAGGRGAAGRAPRSRR